MKSNQNTTYKRPIEVANELGVSKSTILRAVHNGDLKAIQHKGYKGRKGAILITDKDVTAWLRKQFSPVARVNSSEVAER